MMAKTKLKNCERGGQSVIFDLTNDLLGRLLKAGMLLGLLAIAIGEWERSF